jgi:NAD(P)-dependent dehydrogenase (short-subunit alcohol dehydrogenase family)
VPVSERHVLGLEPRAHCSIKLRKNGPEEFLRTLSPIPGARDIAETVFYLTEASQVTGEVLHVDGGAHLGRW